jgi:putative peptidoglycan lipid II flippase
VSDQSLVRSSAVMAGGTLASRILGVIRASMLTGLLGVGGALGYDAFSTANTVPTTIYNLVAGGLLNAVLVPQIVRAAKHDDGGEDFLNRLLTLALVGLVGVTVLVVALSPLVPIVFATSRWDSHAVALCVAFAFWCMPQVFFYGAYTMLGQVLNARGNFGPYMWAPVANNVVAIAGIGVLLVSVGAAGSHPRPPSAWTNGQIAMLGGTATLGVAVQALVLLWPLHALGIRYRPRFGWRGVGLRSAGRVAGWTFLAALMGQLGFIVTSRVVTSAVAQHGPGRGAYDNAFLLFMLPHSLITVSLVTALFTRMSRSAAAGRTDDVRRDVSLGLRMTGVATVLATAAVLALGPEIASTLFAINDLKDTDAIAYTSMAMILGVVPFSAQYLLQRAFYAYEDARTPFLIQIPVILTGATGAIIALETLQPKWIVVGVGVGLSIGYGLGAMLSFLVLRRRIGGVEGRSVLRTYLRLVVAAALSAVPAVIITHALHHALGQGKAIGLLALALGGTAMLATYILVCRRMRVTELDDLISPFVRRFGR